MTEQAEPLDVGPLDIARAKVEGGHSGGELTQFSREEDGDEFGGALAILRGQSEVEIAFEVYCPIRLTTGGGEAVAPDGVDHRGRFGEGVEFKAMPGQQVREMEGDLVDGVVGIFKGGGDGKSLASLKKAEDDSTGRGTSTVVDEGKLSPGMGRAAGDRLEGIAREGVGVMGLCQDLNGSFGW